MSGLVLVWAVAMTGCRSRAVVPAPRLTAAQVREDLAAYRSNFLVVDRSFSPAARSAAEARLAALETNPGEMSLAAMIVELCRIAALAGNAHTGCLFGPPPALESVALTLASLSDGLFVVGVPAKWSDLLGAQLTAVEGRPIARVREAIRALLGGLESYRDERGVAFLVRPQILYALGLAPAPDRARFRFAMGGRDIDREMVAEPPPAPADLRWLLTPEQTPWAFRDLDQPFRWRDAPDLDAIVIQIRYNGDLGGRAIAPFLADAANEREKRSRRNLVIDWRFDIDGGNFLSTRSFFIDLPARIGAGGRVFELLGPRTFSAGIASAAYLKQAGGARVTIVGAPPGDHLTFFSEGRIIALPQSKLLLLPATQRNDFHDGCRAYDDCFAAGAQPGRPTGSPPEVAATVPRIPVAIASLDPDLTAPWTFAAFAAGRDPGIDAIAAALAHH